MGNHECILPGCPAVMFSYHHACTCFYGEIQYMHTSPSVDLNMFSSWPKLNELTHIRIVPYFVTRQLVSKDTSSDFLL